MDLANAGLPIIFLGSDIKRVYGSDRDADSEIAAMYARMVTLDNVRKADTEQEIMNILGEQGVTSHAKYHASQLETTLYRDLNDGTSYYYLYNNAFPDNANMMSNHQADRYKGEEKAMRNVTVTLEGDCPTASIPTQAKWRRSRTTKWEQRESHSPSTD